MSLTKHQILALQNLPLEHKPTSEKCDCFRYYSDTTDTSFSDGTIRILRQLNMVKVEVGTVTITERGQKELDKIAKK